MSDNQITSAQNPKVKFLLQLQQKSSERRKSGLFIIEGRRELLHCIEAGYEVDTVFFCGTLTPEGGSHPEGFELRVDGQTHIIRGCRTFEVSKEVYEKVAYRGSTEGVIAEVRTRNLTLHDLKLKQNPPSPIFVIEFGISILTISRGGFVIKVVKSKAYSYAFPYITRPRTEHCSLSLPTL